MKRKQLGIERIVTEGDREKTKEEEEEKKDEMEGQSGQPESEREFVREFELIKSRIIVKFTQKPFPKFYSYP